jgi:hypothetical protein
MKREVIAALAFLGKPCAEEWDKSRYSGVSSLHDIFRMTRALETAGHYAADVIFLYGTLSDTSYWVSDLNRLFETAFDDRSGLPAPAEGQIITMYFTMPVGQTQTVPLAGRLCG